MKIFVITDSFYPDSIGGSGKSLFIEITELLSAVIKRLRS